MLSDKEVTDAIHLLERARWSYDIAEDIVKKWGSNQGVWNFLNVTNRETMKHAVATLIQCSAQFGKVMLMRDLSALAGKGWLSPDKLQFLDEAENQVYEAMLQSEPSIEPVVQAAMKVAGLLH